jgi:class 3 adenylate cyclase
MLPGHVILDMLMNKPIAESIDKVTILLIVIEDFDAIVREKSPELLLRFLNQQFTKFDEICKHYGVTKIETVGEEYVCCVGVTPTEIEDCQKNPKEHSVAVGKLFRAANAILQQQTESVKFKMGAHTGPVVAGVIAQKLPRYRLFGDTINTAARMMQKGVVGQLQYGDATHEHLPDDVPVKKRGQVEMKGKGNVTTYLYAPYMKSTKSFGMAGENVWSADSPTDDNDDGGGLLEELMGYSDISSDAPDSDLDTNILNSAEMSNRKFKAVVATMTENRSLKNSFRPTRGWILSQREDFTDEMEEAWRKQFHVDNVCKKMEQRLDVQVVGLLVISVVELLWNLPTPRQPDSGWAQEHEELGIWLRLPVFILCRMAGLFCIVATRCAATSVEWFQENPVQVQSFLVGAAWLLVITLYFSYDALVAGVSIVGEDRVLAPTDQIFSLLFVLLFCFIIRGTKLFFVHSLAYIPLAMLIVALSNFRSRSGVYFPVIGQVLFVVIAISYAILAHSEEQSSRARFKAVDSIRTTKERVQSILETMMPPLVLEQIRNSPSGWRAHHTYEHATLAQADLCGFTKLASTRTPVEVVQFIGELFGAFDLLTDKHDIYKVETVGDAYIAGQAEEPLTLVNSPTSVIEFGIAMINEVGEWSKRLGAEVRCRVGIHHGEVIGGIVDKEMQRYHMFGKMMQVIEILESTAPEGRVQVSRACHDAVQRERSAGITIRPRRHQFELKERQSDTLVTSKGEEHTFSETDGKTFLIQVPGHHA